MTLEEEILELLNSQASIKLDEEEKEESDRKQYIEQINHTLVEVFPMIELESRPRFLREAAAFALAKAMERKLLLEIRPGQKPHVWLVIMEIAEGAKFNLPAHLEDKLYDYMDACENAVEQYVNENISGVYPVDLFTKVQEIGSYLVDKHNLKDITVAGLSNERVMTRDELHNFCLQGATKALSEQGYNITKGNLGSANPVSLICEKNGITYTVNVTTAILPKTGELTGWKLREFNKINQDETHRNAILGISIISTDKLYASMGVAIKDGDYTFKVSPLEEVKPLAEVKNNNLY